MINSDLVAIRRLSKRLIYIYADGSKRCEYTNKPIKEEKSCVPVKKIKREKPKFRLYSVKPHRKRSHYRTYKKTGLTIKVAAHEPE